MVKAENFTGWEYIMLNSRARLIIKVAVLCIAVSLLSFFAGTVVGRNPFYVFNKDNNENRSGCYT
jgi:hypothetical protein